MLFPTRFVRPTRTAHAFAMTNKHQRQNSIVQLVGAREIASQEELRALLAERGVSVTQATLSRDLRELGIVRAPGDEGPRYLLPQMVAGEVKPSLDSLLPQFFSRIDGVGELVVLHTLPGGAQPIAEGLDSEGWEEVLGTIAGENTILIVCRSADARAVVTDRIMELGRST